MKVYSWHCTHDYFAETSRMIPTTGKDDRLTPIRLNHTHYRVPVSMEFTPERLFTDPEHVLAKAFDYFNWVQWEFDAPDEVNACAHQYETHASQSVGDIVEIEGEGYWMVKGSGWKKLSDADLHSLEIVT